MFGLEAAFSALLGMMLAILHYEWAHYVAHIPYQPRTRLGRWIKQYHLRHHFISEKHWFGVSTRNQQLRSVFKSFFASAAPLAIALSCPISSAVPLKLPHKPPQLAHNRYFEAANCEAT